jgi:hypothetical protein
MSLAFLSRLGLLRQLDRLDLRLLEHGFSVRLGVVTLQQWYCIRPVLLRVHACVPFVQASRY